jgi:hypothetical protein
MGKEHGRLLGWVAAPANSIATTSQSITQRRRPARPRVTCSANCRAGPGLPRAMALPVPRAAIGRPFSPCTALPARRTSTSTVGSGLGSFEFPRPQHPGEQCARASVGAPRRAYPRIEATARRGARTENPKVRNKRLQKKVSCLRCFALRLGFSG